VATVRCPDCGREVPVPPGSRTGDLLDCPGCAGLALRVREQGGGWTASIAHVVSCPRCERRVVLPETAAAGQVVQCCGHGWRLTWEFGAFALEAEPDGPEVPGP
jgi:endogenous inhibitor of DNA gyrase (YacG/DUF329 family)